MDAREEIKRWLALLIQLGAESESKQIKQDMDMLLGVAAELTGILASKNEALARQCRPRSAKPPKASPAKGPQQQKGDYSSTDTPKPQNDAEGRSQGQSRIMQGVRQADPTMADQRRVALNKVYGAQNDDVAFRKTAKAIAS